MRLNPDVRGEAYPLAGGRYRYWLSRIWDRALPLALAIGINPNTATEREDDGMTSFLTEVLRKLEDEHRCGGFILVNCYDFRDSDPNNFKREFPAPSGNDNLGTIRSKLAECRFVVASWGTTKYGTEMQARRREIADVSRQSGKPVICFSPKGRPIFCSRTSQNSPDGRWSKTPVQWDAAARI